MRVILCESCGFITINWWFKDFDQNLMNELINQSGIYRTAPVTRGWLIREQKEKIFLDKVKKIWHVSDQIF